MSVRLLIVSAAGAGAVPGAAAGPPVPGAVPGPASVAGAAPRGGGRRRARVGRRRGGAGLGGERGVGVGRSDARGLLVRVGVTEEHARPDLIELLARFLHEGAGQNGMSARRTAFLRPVALTGVEHPGHGLVPGRLLQGDDLLRARERLLTTGGRSGHRRGLGPLVVDRPTSWSHGPALLLTARRPSDPRGYPVHCQGTIARTRGQLCRRYVHDSGDASRRGAGVDQAERLREVDRGERAHRADRVVAGESRVSDGTRTRGRRDHNPRLPVPPGVRLALRPGSNTSQCRLVRLGSIHGLVRRAYRRIRRKRRVDERRFVLGRRIASIRR